jgi:hypothetical protein
MRKRRATLDVVIADEVEDALLGKYRCFIVE